VITHLIGGDLILRESRCASALRGRFPLTLPGKTYILVPARKIAFGAAFFDSQPISSNA
jgi:hypothetical protein